jgi:glycosyltransferase involved in cell wall biosynthesis
LTLSRVCIDGLNLSRPSGSGIATYARNLNESLRAIGYGTQILYGPKNAPSGDDRLDEAMLHDAPRPPGPAWRSGLARVGRLSRAGISAFGRTARAVAPTGALVLGPRAVAADRLWAARDLFNAAGLAFAWHRGFTSVSFAGVDAPQVMHWTCPLPLQAKGAPNLYTIHDLIPLTLPYATLDNKRAFHALIGRICATADQVVTVSEISRRDIIRAFGIGEDRVVNTYQAVDLPAAVRDRPEADVRAELERLYGLDWRGYFLFFAAIEPKKNLARLIEAYLTAGVASPLIVVGASGWLEGAETALLQPGLTGEWKVVDGVARRTDKVRRYDHLPLAMLASLIRGARAVLFPSLYEGFGLPALEAMQLGAPVLASTGGALPEVVGDAAVLVDPFDVDAIRKAIRTLDADPDLRDALTQRGLARSLEFSPENYRARLANLYGRLT